MGERPPEISSLCTAREFSPGEGVAVMDQLEAAPPLVRVAIPVKTEPLGMLVSQNTTLVSWMLAGLTPESSGVVVAVPSKTVEPVPAPAFGKVMETPGGFSAKNSAVKTRFD